MPTASQHKVKAEHNRKFLDTISVQDFPDWVAVVAFYTAVHLMERVRAASGHGDSVDHGDRLAYIQRFHVTIHSQYHLLQNVSMLSRYQSRADFYDQFQPEDIQKQILEDKLPAIESYVSERLGS